MGEKRRTTIWADKEAIAKLQLMHICLSDVCNKALKNEVFKYETLSITELQLEMIKREREIIEARKAIIELKESIRRREREDATIESEEMSLENRERAEEDLIMAEWKAISEDLTSKIAETGGENWAAILDLLKEYKEKYPLHGKRLDKYHALRAWKDTQVVKVKKRRKR